MVSCASTRMQIKISMTWKHDCTNKKCEHHVTAFQCRKGSKIYESNSGTFVTGNSDDNFSKNELENCCMEITGSEWENVLDLWLIWKSLDARIQNTVRKSISSLLFARSAFWSYTEIISPCQPWLAFLRYVSSLENDASKLFVGWRNFSTWKFPRDLCTGFFFPSRLFVGWWKHFTPRAERQVSGTKWAENSPLDFGKLFRSLAKWGYPIKPWKDNRSGHFGKGTSKRRTVQKIKFPLI